MEPETGSSPPSRTSSSASKKSGLSLDLSDLPPLIPPTPPSNTLLFTNLQSLDIFRPENLQTIRDLVAQTAPIHAWAPLKSFRRIVVSFFDEQSAINVRAIWDGEAILGERCKVYFGQPTPIGDTLENQRLALPDAGKLFFISPPPSPPHGWEMKLEDAPNKVVHAEDLAEALSKLRHQGPSPAAAIMTDSSVTSMATGAAAASHSPISPIDGGNKDGSGGFVARPQRSRSSTLIFHPEEHGGSPNLPCIAVDDMTDDLPEDMSPVGGQEKPIMAHTARPPVELMHDA